MQGSFSHLPHRGLSIQESQISFVKKLVQLLGDVSRIELFARQTSHGFDVWG